MDVVELEGVKGDGRKEGAVGCEVIDRGSGRMGGGCGGDGGRGVSARGGGGCRGRRVFVLYMIGEGGGGDVGQTASWARMKLVGGEGGKYWNRGWVVELAVVFGELSPRCEGGGRAVAREKKTAERLAVHGGEGIVGNRVDAR